MSNKLFSGMFAKKPIPKAPGVLIERDYYTMATVEGDTAEITMYGEIVEKQPVDWWTGNPIEGQYIIESEFLKDLKAVEGAKTITIRMNSLGGDAGVSILIHNRLRELAMKGTTLICIVDGIAMSGGSLIMSACDIVRVNPSSLVMIHKCWSFLFGGYNADELRQAADSNDAWDKAQVAIYSRKCKLSETVIKHMMSETTYMTGKEAVEKGFADELLDDAEPIEIAASANKRTLYVNGRAMHMSGMKIPDDILTVATAKADEINKKLPATTGSEGGKNPMANTIEELRAEYPELTNQLESEAKAAVSAVPQASIDEAVETERKRQQEIDDIAPAVNDDELVQEAKYGEKACTAQELAFRAMQKQAKQGEKHSADINADYQTSNAAAVGASPNGGEENQATQVEAAVDKGVEAAKEALSRR